MSLLPFNDIQTFLDQSSSMMGTSEIHGFICGFLCGVKEAEFLTCLELIFSLSELKSMKETQDILHNLYQFTHSQITHESFHLLLPSHEESLQWRAQSIRFWCQGFLTGIGLTGIDYKNFSFHEGDDSEKFKEILFNFSEISKLDDDNVDLNDIDSEKAYTELQKYIRHAVLFIYNKLKHFSSTTYLH